MCPSLLQSAVLSAAIAKASSLACCAARNLNCDDVIHLAVISSFQPVAEQWASLRRPRRRRTRMTPPLRRAMPQASSKADPYAAPRSLLAINRPVQSTTGRAAGNCGCTGGRVPSAASAPPTASASPLVLANAGTHQVRGGHPGSFLCPARPPKPSTICSCGPDWPLIELWGSGGLASRQTAKPQPTLGPSVAARHSRCADHPPLSCCKGSRLGPPSLPKQACPPTSMARARGDFRIDSESEDEREVMEEDEDEEVRPLPLHCRLRSSPAPAPRAAGAGAAFGHRGAFSRQCACRPAWQGREPCAVHNCRSRCWQYGHGRAGPATASRCTSSCASSRGTAA